MRRVVVALLGLAIAGLAAAAPARAQYFAFGQNKIQYRNFEWRVLRGPHVDLYYYPTEAELAQVSLAYAEASYDTLALQFGHEVRTRIPLIVYASFADFEQTNILPFTPPEGLLGVTEFLKRRVALPFRGNLAEFRHTLRHELVHVFQLSLGADAYFHVARGSRVDFPLWWTEGLAELWSGGEDARDEMILRDLVFGGRLPPIQDLAFYTGPMVYPLGGRIHRWLADTYGDWRVAMMYREMTEHETFDDALKSVYGRSIEQLNEEFQLAMRRRYYPTAETRIPLPVIATRLGETAIKPAYVPDSADGPGAAAYISVSGGLITVYERSLDGSERPRRRRLVTAERTAGLESFHPFESRLDASRPGYLLASARVGDRDALVIWDSRRGRLAGRYQFPELVSIVSPAWLPDRTGIVFSGLSESGVADLYRLDLADGRLEQLTRDHYQDLDPSPSPDGTRIVFASDRTAGGDEGAVNLFVLDLRDRGVRQLTAGAWVDEAPLWADDGRIYFASSRDGVLNVFSADSSGAGRRETSAWTGAFDPAKLPGERGLLVGGFNELSWNVYSYPVDSVARLDTFPAPAMVPPAQWAWHGGSAVPAAEVSGQPYRRRFTLDFAAGDMAFVPGRASAQGIAFLASDMLGDHLLYGSLSSFQGRDLGGLLTNINASAFYLNRKHRVNWGIGAFRSKGTAYEGDVLPAYSENSVGVLGQVRYPLSRMSRIEATVVLERSDRVDLTLPVAEPRRVGLIASNYVTYVRDRSLWLPTGPIEGSRLSVTAGVSSDFSNSRFDSFLLLGDWRRYFRLSGRSAYALRAVGFYSDGDRPRRTNIGGVYGLRGYPIFGYIVGTRAWMINNELRFPMLNHLTFGTPAGDVRFPEIQGAIFTDIGRAWFGGVAGVPAPDRATIGSYGVSIRLPLAALAVLRLDIGRKFSSGNYRGYSLTQQQRKTGFVQFFFGFNY